MEHQSLLDRATQLLGQIGKEVFLRRTMAYGTYFGTGVFCLTDEGEHVQQIGWVPEKDQAIWMLLERHVDCQTSMPQFTTQVPKV